MKTKYFFQLLVLCLGLAIVAAGTSNVRAECTDQTNFNIKGYCKSDANDGYYIKAGVGIPIARAGFQCKFLQVSNANINKVIFIPYAPGTTGDNEFTSLLNAVSNSSNISAFVSLSNCTAVCDSNNNLVVTVGGSMFTYPCGDYSECINDVSGNGHCMPVGCSNISISASAGYYQYDTDTTPLIWCPHVPISRQDKANGLDTPTITNQTCPLAPIANMPCAFSTCGNGQLDSGEDCDTTIDTTGRCVNCDCGNFVTGTGGYCQSTCIMTPTCTGDTPFLVNCGCSMCPANETLMWAEKVQCKLYGTKSMVYGVSPTSTTTFYELPKTCKSCGNAESNGTYTPKIKVRTHGFYKNNYSTNVPYDRDISTTCNDFVTGSPKNIYCIKEVTSGSILNLVDNQGVDCPAGTYNDTSINEAKRGILSCNLCSGSINTYYSGIISGSLGKPYYYDGSCHACEKGRTPTYYGNTSWFYCAQYGIADLNNDGDVTDPGENLSYNLGTPTSDPDAPLYNRNSSCDSNKDGLLDSNKAYHRWYTSSTCVPYNFCTDTAITDGSIYLNCPQITDPTTLAALQSLKPSCPAEKQTLVTTPTEYVNTVCTPCPDGYNHISAYITLMQSNGTTLNFDYRTQATTTNPNVNAGKFTCHTTCTSAAPYYYNDGSGLTCHSCPQGYTQIQNTWSSSYNAQYIQCSQISCPLMSLIYSDGGGAPPTCHACPQNTFQLANTTNWPLPGSKCWPQKAYCNNTKYPTTNTKYATGIFYRHVTQSTTFYDATTGALTKRDDSPNNLLPPFYTDNSIYTTDPAICDCPAGTRYEDHAYNGTSVPDYSYFYNADVNLYRPTVYCVDCPAGSDYFYQGTGDTSPVCHTCAKTYYYQAAGESSPSCHTCTSSYFYQGAGDPAPTCHVCPQSQPICPAAFNCSLPQYSCNIYGDPDFDPDAWDHMPNCDCRCKLTAAACTGAKPYLNPVLCKCQATSLSAYCGNGVLDSGEECDTTEDGDSYTDTNGVPHINRCIACKIHRVSGCDSRAYTTWVNGAYTERPVTGQCATTLASNSGAGLTAYSCSFWEPKHINTVLDPTPVHQSEATASSGCIFTCQSGYTYNSTTKTCEI